MLDAAPMAEWSRKKVLGYVGSGTKSAFYGARMDGWLFRSSGEGSNTAYRQDWPLTTKCTRIDLALTVWYAAPWPTLAVEVAEAARAARDTGAMHRSTRLCYYDGLGDGDSTYIGSRSSEQMLRVYDKGAESQEPRYNGSWRWEIEFKGGRSQLAWRELRGHLDASQSIMETVGGWLAERGIPIGPGDCGPDCIRVIVTGGTSDDPARLDWLAKAVRPTVAGLLDRMGKAAVYSALGLPT